MFRNNKYVSVHNFLQAHANEIISTISVNETGNYDPLVLPRPYFRRDITLICILELS